MCASLLKRDLSFGGLAPETADVAIVRAYESLSEVIIDVSRAPGELLRTGTDRGMVKTVPLIVSELVTPRNQLREGPLLVMGDANWVDESLYSIGLAPVSSSLQQHLHMPSVKGSAKETPTRLKPVIRYGIRTPFPGGLNTMDMVTKPIPTIKNIAATVLISVKDALSSRRRSPLVVGSSASGESMIAHRFAQQLRVRPNCLCLLGTTSNGNMLNKWFLTNFCSNAT